MSVRLYHFAFSVSSTFTLEFGESDTSSNVGYLRFFANGQAVMSGSSPYEIATPWIESELLALQFKQVNDTIRITHPDHAPRILTRITDTSWTLTELQYDEDNEPPFLEENITDTTITIAESDVDAGSTITLVASSVIFEAGHVGSYWRIAHVREASSITRELDTDGTSASLRVFGTWHLTSYKNWGGTLFLEQSTDGGTTWETIRTYHAFTSGGVGSRTIDETGEAEEDCLMRLRETSGAGDSDAIALLETFDAVLYGYVQITAVDGSGNGATATVIKGLEASTATTLWSEGAWSDVRGYPRAIATHEQRMLYAGTTYQPSRIWGSEVDGYDNFRRDDEDESLSWTHALAGEELNTIQWMASHDALLIGTTGSEWRAYGDLQGGSITATDIDAKEFSFIGSAHVQAIRTHDSVLFLELKAARLHEVVRGEGGGFGTADLTLFASHLFEDGRITQMAWQRDQRILWCVTSDGRLLGLTYQRDQEVVGWHSHDTDGLFKSVATIYGDVGAEDEVWVAVQRTIGSSTVEYIERLYPLPMVEIEDGVFLDSCILYDGSPANDFTGADHLSGETCTVLADGEVYESITVDGSGGFSLPSGVSASQVVIGLAYTSILSPYRLDADSGAGVSIGRIRRITDLTLRLLSSAAPEFVMNDESPRTVDLPDHLRALALLGHAEKNGRKEAADIPLTDFKPDHGYDNRIEIRMSDPLPLTVLALAAMYDLG